jgi:hypothetical protein
MTGRCGSQRGSNGGGSGFNPDGFEDSPVTGLGQEAAGRSVGGRGVLHLETKVWRGRERKEGRGGDPAR